MDIMLNANITDGMFPTKWALSNAIPVNGTYAHPARLILRQSAELAP